MLRVLGVFRASRRLCRNIRALELPTSVSRSFGVIFMSVYIDLEAGEIVHTGALQKMQTVVYFLHFV